MKLGRNLRSRRSRGARPNAPEGTRRIDKWPAWKKNPMLIRYISLLK